MIDDHHDDQSAADELAEDEKAAFAVFAEAAGLHGASAATPRAAASVKALELLFAPRRPCLSPLRRFSGVVTLRLIGLGLRDGDLPRGALARCGALRALWLPENRLRSLESVVLALAAVAPAGAAAEAAEGSGGGGIGLKELYLYSNRLSCVNGIGRLSSLQVLSVADNFLRSLGGGDYGSDSGGDGDNGGSDGIGALTQLTRLDAASNELALWPPPTPRGDDGNGSSRGSSSSSNIAALAGCRALRALNLAANRVATFSEVSALARALPSLDDLRLSDPAWGACPVASLPNYGAAALAALPASLTALDGLSIAPAARAAAVASFDRKRAFYALRERGLRRAAARLCDLAEAQGLNAARARCDEALRELQLAALELRRRQAQGSSSSSDDILQSLEAASTAWRACRAGADAGFEALVNAASAAVDVAVAVMAVERDTAGNVQLSELCDEENGGGAASVAWLESWLQARLSAGGDCSGIAVRVTSALRVDNRMLLAAVAASMAAAQNVSQQQQQEPLWMYFGGGGSSGPASDQPDAFLQLLAAASDGVPAGSELRATIPALERDQKRAVLLCGLPPSTAAAPETARVAGLHEALPRFLVEFKLVDKSSSSGGGRNSIEGLPLAAWGGIDGDAARAAISAACNGGTAAMARAAAEPLLPWLELAAQRDAAQPNGRASLQWSRQWVKAEAAASLALGRANAMLQGGEGLHPLPSSPAPREQLLARITAAAAAEAANGGGGAVARLDAHGCGLGGGGGSSGVSVARQLAPLGALTALASLSLACNGLRGADLAALADQLSQARLRELDLSFNCIRVYQGNPCESVDAVAALLARLPVLSSLLVEGNPAAYAHGAAAALALEAPCLRSLDGVAINDGGGQLPLPKVVPIDSDAQQQQQQQQQQLLLVAPRLGLAQLVLPPLPAAASALVAADVSCNALTSLTPLAACAALTRLDASSNSLTAAAVGAALSGLKKLADLDVSRNPLGAGGLRGLAVLTALTRLAADDVPWGGGREDAALLQCCCSGGTCSSSSTTAGEPGSATHTRGGIESLAGVEAMAALADLSCAGAASLRGLEAEARRLSGLPRLAALDLSGSPLVAERPDARAFLIFALRGLAALDGAPVTAAEAAAARAAFAGRLTAQMLESRLEGSGQPRGATPTSTPRSLDLSRLGLRDLGRAFARPRPPPQGRTACCCSCSCCNGGSGSNSWQWGALAALALDDNRLALAALPALSDLRSLASLSLANNCLAERSGSSSSGGAAGLMPAAPPPSAEWALVALQTLIITGCGLCSFEPFELARRAPLLRRLDASNNALASLAGLAGCGRLRELLVSRNARLRGLDGAQLAPLTRLRELHAADCGLHSLGGAGALGALTLLAAPGNRFGAGGAAGNELERLAALIELREANLAGSPLARRPAYRHALALRLPQLRKLDGRPVTREDREYARLLLAPPAPASQQEDGDGCGAHEAGARDDGSGGISGWAGLLPAPRAQQWLGAARAYGGGGGGNEGRATGSSGGSNDGGGGQSAAPTPPAVLDLTGPSLKGVGFGGGNGAPAATSCLISRGV